MLVNGTLFTSHVEAWESLWNEGRIDLAGNDSIALTTYAGLYYLLSSLPLENSQSWPFIGLSPEGLAHGGKSEVRCVYVCLLSFFISYFSVSRIYFFLLQLSIYVKDFRSVTNLPRCTIRFQTPLSWK